MNWFKNRTTVTKLMFGFGLLALLIGFVGYRGLTAVSEVNAMLDTMYARDMAGLSAVKEANINLIYIGRAIRAALLTTDRSEIEKQVLDATRSIANMNSELDKVEKTLATDAGRALMAKIKTSLSEYLPQVREALRLAQTGQTDAAKQIVVSMRQVANQVDDDLTGLATSKDKLGRQAFDESATLYAGARTLMTTIIAVSVLLAIGLGLFLARLVSAPMVQAVNVLEAVAKGDLTRSLDLNTRDELGQMAGALNQAVGAMRETMRQVGASAEGVAEAAQQLASSSEELSSGAQQQASSQEETSATMEEITSTVKRNADNARQASQLATGARESAETGGEVVANAVTAMGEINSSSKKIADIITTIDEIAFQTNLLALNAAVEAARAGEQGRGFAVVASEVRNLAQRSAASAKEIKGLIQDSVRKVENGSDLVNRSGRTLTEIVGSVKRVTDIVAEIAAASQEQATGIEQVGRAMSQMDQVTQQNSTQTEELSSTAQSLAGQAAQLQSLVAQFKVDEQRASRGPQTRAFTPPPPARSASKKPMRVTAPVRSEAALSHLAAHVNEPAPQPGAFIEF